MVTKSLLSLVFLACAVSPALAQKNCPTINGRFEMRKTVDGKELIFGFNMYTRQEAGIFSYTVKADTFHVADGKLRPVELNGIPGLIKSWCTGTNTLEQQSMDREGKGVSWRKMTPMDQCRVAYESDLSRRNGIYSKC
jgi:hypothetical protein